MTQAIQVTCLIDRYWDPTTMAYAGETVTGHLVDVAAQTSSDMNETKQIPVGIVMLDDGKFVSVPIEFIQKQGG